MSITIKQFIANYKEAEGRATVCARGKAFSVSDRIALNAQRKQLNLDCNQASALFGGTAGQGKHYNRFLQWEAQIKNGHIGVAPAATGAHVGKVIGGKIVINKPEQEQMFDGRIKSLDDVQPAFNRAARQLIKVGVTDPAQVVKYIHNAFEVAKVEQKIDLKAERIVNELRIGDLTKEQIIATLDRVKTQF